MVKIRKIVALALVAITLLAICLVTGGCTDDKGRLRQVSFKVSCFGVGDNGVNYGREKNNWIIRKGQHELHIEQEYDGQKYSFRLSSWETPKSDKFAYRWAPIEQGELYYSLWKEGDPKENVRDFVCEKGNYVLTIYTSSERWRPQIIRMYISII